MLAYVIRRLWQMIPTMLGVVLLIFILFNWVGGDPAYILAGKMSNPEQIENIRKQLGVDQPYYVQLWIFIKQILTFDYVISIILALAVAAVRGSLTDRMVMMLCTIGMSISILVYIIVFQYVLAYQLSWFPVQGWSDSFTDNLFKFSLLPILIMLVVSIAPTLRLYRSFVLDEVNQDYVRTARAKGVGESRILSVHVLRNASIPIITDVMSNLPALLIGAFLIERFFGIPGIGREVIIAVERSDFPVIKAITVYIAAATMIFNLIADLVYKVVDPRVQLK
ncbi:ABC transporter permease [Acinetobacter baumannii]